MVKIKIWMLELPPDFSAAESHPPTARKIATYGITSFDLERVWKMPAERERSPLAACPEAEFMGAATGDRSRSGLPKQYFLTGS